MFASYLHLYLYIYIIRRIQFASKPVLVKGDGPMGRQRRWFKQFYTVKEMTHNDNGVPDMEDLANR